MQEARKRYPVPEADAAGLLIGPELDHKLDKQGISSRAIDPVCKYLGLGKGALAEYLDLDRTTAARLIASDRPLPTHSAESMSRLLELQHLALDTFECPAGAMAWLGKPNPLLEGDSPLEAAKTSFGGERVRDLLLAIKYGGAA